MSARPNPSIAAPADKRFRRADTRPGRRAGGGWWRARATRWALIAVATIATGAMGVRHLISRGVFDISTISVRGNQHLSRGEVLMLLDGLQGQNVLSADFESYRARLLESPWVAGATFRRVLPATIDVRVVERAPMAIGRLGAQLFLVDATGVIIDEYGPQYAAYDLPIVDGLTKSPADAAAGAVDPARAALVAAFVQSLAQVPAIRDHVSQVDVSDPHDLVAILDRDPVTLRLGDRDFAARLQRYVELAPTLKEQISEIDAVDLRFDERIPVSRKPAGTVARTADDPSRGKH
jgi:cell division protein FtsQ